MGDDAVVRPPLVSLPAHLEPLPHTRSTPEPVPPRVPSLPSLSLSSPPHTSPSPSPSHPPPSTMHSQRFRTYGNSAFPRAADSDEGTDSEESLFIQMKDEEEEERELGTNITPHTPTPHTFPHSTHSPHTHRSHLHPPPHTLSNSPPSWQHQESLSEDLVCMICACLLHDPMSLHCGHSFCNLCLAAMWQSAREPGSAAGLHCPVCRASWRNYPAVNIQLRNIIERSYPNDSRNRKSAISSEDEGLLHKFKLAKENESQLKDKANINLRQDDIRRLVSGLCFIFIAVISLLVLVFIVTLWVWSGAGGEFMRTPVSQWNQEDVAEWVTSLGDWASQNYSTLFLKEHINGNRLLRLDEEALLAIGIKNSYRRRSILLAIQDLKEEQFITPRNFNEFKAAYRKQTLLIAMVYSMWPRLTIFYTYYFDKYEIFLPFLRFHFPSREKVEVEGEGRGDEVGNGEDSVGEEGEEKVPQQPPSWGQLLAFTVEFLLIPHIMVALYAWSWVWRHPWLTIPIIAHCVRQTWMEGKLPAYYLKRIVLANWDLAHWGLFLSLFLRSAVKNTVKQFCSFFIFLVVASLLWHAIPHFICDLFFYYLIWHTLFFHYILSPVLRCVPNRNFRAQFQMNFGAE